MTVFSSVMTLPSGAVVIRDTVAQLVAAARSNLFPGACSLWEMSVDNTANAAQQVYLKVYNATAPATTADPDLCIPIPAGVSMTIQILEGLALGTGCSFGVSTLGGSSAGANPTNSVIVALTLTS